MQLKVLLPTQILLNEAVSKVVAEAVNGSPCGYGATRRFGRAVQDPENTGT